MEAITDRWFAVWCVLLRKEVRDEIDERRRIPLTARNLLFAVLGGMWAKLEIGLQEGKRVEVTPHDTIYLTMNPMSKSADGKTRS